MSGLKSLFRSSVIVTALVIAALAVASLMVSRQSVASMTAAPVAALTVPPRVQVTGAELTKVAQKTEALRAAAVARVNDEDDQPLARKTEPAQVGTVIPRNVEKGVPVATTTVQPLPPVSPEQAMNAVFASGQDTSQVSNIVLMTLANGQQVYQVNVAGPTPVVIDVDATTGAIIPSGTGKP